MQMQYTNSRPLNISVRKAKEWKRYSKEYCT